MGAAHKETKVVPTLCWVGTALAVRLGLLGEPSRLKGARSHGGGELCPTVPTDLMARPRPNYSWAPQSSGACQPTKL